MLWSMNRQKTNFSKLTHGWASTNLKLEQLHINNAVKHCYAKNQVKGEVWYFKVENPTSFWKNEKILFFATKIMQSGGVLTKFKRLQNQ